MAPRNTSTVQGHNLYDPPELSELGACCLTRLHARDYRLVKDLVSTACHGKMADSCKAALESILIRRERYLNERITCDDAVMGTQTKSDSSFIKDKWDKRITLAADFNLLIVPIFLVVVLLVSSKVARQKPWSYFIHRNRTSCGIVNKYRNL